MITLEEIETATAERLANELAAACECTEDWERIPTHRDNLGIVSIPWEHVCSYLCRCYGDEGNEFGEIPISIARDATGWVVAETPPEAIHTHGRYSSREAAIAAAESLREELDISDDD